jgi:hypothetical protein
MSCVLRVGGANFAVEELLADSQFKPSAVFRAGEPRSPSKPEGRKRAFSGFNFDVSEADFSRLTVQIKDATRFLEENKKELFRLATFSGMEEISLDF